MEILNPHFTHGVSCTWVEIRAKIFVDLGGWDQLGNLAIESMEEIDPGAAITEKRLHARGSLSISLIQSKLAMPKRPAFTFCDKKCHYCVAGLLNQYFAKGKACSLWPGSSGLLKSDSYYPRTNVSRPECSVTSATWLQRSAVTEVAVCFWKKK